MKKRADTYPGLVSHFSVPIFLVVIMWAVFLINLEFDLNLTRFGLYPRTAEGLRGIFTIPFLHGSWSHLINNSIPMLVLGWALFKFYRPVAFKTLIGIYIVSGIWLWISGRPSYHIGASGVIYGMATFLFISGMIRKEKKVAALSLLVAFLYGGMWWGVLPVDPTVSWEGHFWGALAGVALAFLYRKQGPTKPKYQWEIDEEKEIAMAEKQRHGDLDSAVDISYTFIPNSDSDSETPKQEQNNS